MTGSCLHGAHFYAPDGHVNRRGGRRSMIVVASEAVVVSVFKEWGDGRLRNDWLKRRRMPLWMPLRPWGFRYYRRGVEWTPLRFALPHNRR